jgi:predicted secreted Zn-dependent protease
VEKEYVKGLHKLVMKAKKTVKKCVGSVQNAWQKMVVELEAEEEIHRSLSFGLSQDVAKVLNGLTEQQIKQRHAVENAVKDRLKVYGEKQKQQLRVSHAHTQIT